MNKIKLENNMILHVLPLPNDINKYCYEVIGFYDGYSHKFFYSNGSDIDKYIVSILFKNKYNSKFLHYMSYVLLNDEIKVIEYGRTIHKKLDGVRLFTNDFRFKKLHVSIDMFNLSGQQLPVYDKSSLTEHYFDIKFKSYKEYVDSHYDVNDIKNFLEMNSISNNLDLISQFFKRENFGDLTCMIRDIKMKKIKEKMK